MGAISRRHPAWPQYTTCLPSPRRASPACWAAPSLLLRSLKLSGQWTAGTLVELLLLLLAVVEAEVVLVAAVALLLLVWLQLLRLQWES